MSKKYCPCGFPQSSPIEHEHNRGKYELDYYTICGANCRDKFGNKSERYWIKWLASGGITMGFDTAAYARRVADRTVQHCLDTPGLNASNL